MAARRSRAASPRSSVVVSLVVSCEASACSDSAVCGPDGVAAAALAGADACVAGAAGAAGDGELRPHAVMLIRLRAIATDSRNIVASLSGYRRFSAFPARRKPHHGCLLP